MAQRVVPTVYRKYNLTIDVLFLTDIHTIKVFVFIFYFRSFNLFGLFVVCHFIYEEVDDGLP